MKEGLVLLAILALVAAAGVCATAEWPLSPYNAVGVAAAVCQSVVVDFTPRIHQWVMREAEDPGVHMALFYAGQFVRVLVGIILVGTGAYAHSGEYSVYFVAWVGLVEVFSASIHLALVSSACSLGAPPATREETTELTMAVLE